MRNLLPVLAACSAISGVVLGAILHPPVILSVIVMCIATFTGIIFLILSKKPEIAWKIRNYHYIWVFLLFASLGMFSEFTSRPSSPVIKNGETVIVNGTVERVTNNASGDKLILKVYNIHFPASGVNEGLRNFKIVIFTDATDLIAGDKIIARGTINNLISLENPFESKPPEILSYGNGEKYRMSVPSENIKFYGVSNSIKYYALRARYNIESLIEKSRLSTQTKGFITAIVLGDRDYLESERRSKFRDAGVTHFIAVSGMHIAIIAGIILFIFFPFNAIGKYKWRYIVAIFPVWGYIMISGLSLSSVRAGIMLTILFIAYITERSRNPLNSLLWAIFLILIFFPYSLFDVGFQLSVVCVGALIMFANPLNTIDHRLHPFIYKVNGLFLTTFIATLASWVLVSFYFERVSIAFLPANIIALPLLPVYFALAISYIIILGILGKDLNLIGEILDKSYEWFCKLIDYISNLPEGVLNFSAGGISVLLWLILLITGGILMYSERKKVWVLSCGVIFTCFIISLPVYARPQPEEGYVILPSFPELTIREYRAGEYKDYIIPRAQNSRIKINGKGILVLDSEFKLDDNCDADIILISQGWHGNPKELLTLNNHDINIIIHPSVRRVRELEILEQLNDNQYKSHSLRHKGFFKI